jgi:hypothetical protein
MKRRGWRHKEKLTLVENYRTLTIKELEKLLPGRTRDSINSEIKRLKAEGKIIGGKTEETKKRSYEQRMREV